MANYSIKNVFSEAFFPPLLSIISQGEISASFDFAPSQPSFHQDMSRNLKGAVKCKTKPSRFFFSSLFMLKLKDEAYGKENSIKSPSAKGRALRMRPLQARVELHRFIYYFV